MSLMFARTYATIKPHVPMIKFRKGGPSLASVSSPAATEQQTSPAAASGLSENIQRIIYQGERVILNLLMVRTRGVRVVGAAGQVQEAAH